MSAMSDIATEIELYWQRHGYNSYRRTLPNGDVATVSPTGGSGFSLTVAGQRSYYEGIAPAIAAAGHIAQRHLRHQAMTWTA